MYQWDKSINSLDLEADQVIQLFRSMRDVQLALPGLPAQEATAYLCQYQSAQGVGTVVAFHLHKSAQLAFYIDAPIVVAAERADAVLDQSLTFVESMGFLMSNLDIQLLGEADRRLLWSSLPLQQGIARRDRGAAEPAAAPESSAAVAAPSAPRPDSQGDRPETAGPGEGADVSPTADRGGIDDLLAAVEALRTRRPGVRPRKSSPAADELQRRRHELRDAIGRIQASL